MYQKLLAIPDNAGLFPSLHISLFQQFLSRFCSERLEFFLFAVTLVKYNRWLAGLSQRAISPDYWNIDKYVILEKREPRERDSRCATASQMCA